MLKDITNQVINGYKVLSIDGYDVSGHAIWKCACVNCGEIAKFTSYDLTHPGRRNLTCKNCKGNYKGKKLIDFLKTKKEDKNKNNKDNNNSSPFGDADRLLISDDGKTTLDFSNTNIITDNKTNYNDNNLPDDISLTNKNYNDTAGCVYAGDTPEFDSYDSYSDYTHVNTEIPDSKISNYNTYFENKLKVTYSEGEDIFDSPIYYHIAHCIPDDMTFYGKTAKKINELFDISLEVEEFDDFKTECGVCEYLGGVFNLIVSDSHNHYSTSYGALSKALTDMFEIAFSKNIQYIVMPKIGSGSNKLAWDKVYDSIVSAFRTAMLEYDKEIPENYSLNLKICDNKTSFKTSFLNKNS